MCIAMKKLSALFLIAFSFAILSIPAQAGEDDPVLIRINGHAVTKSEFSEVYYKNNLAMEVADPRSVEEYLELYINFKLKVLEAQALGLDTNPAFTQELASYREQLARPYFYDQEVSDQLLEEAYQRMQYDIRASHILISVSEHAPPADTLEAYKRIMAINERLKTGESFSDLARQESEDPSARDRAATANRPAFRGNAGDLGYFTVFNMVYPFESAAYNTPVGELAGPVRSSFGYHLIKVTDRLPAMGRARAAHIMVNSPAGTPSEQAATHQEKINEIYQRLKNGEDFESLAQEFSDDRPSAQRGGLLPEFTSNRMVPEFIKAISDMENPGDISSPVKTDFGWHIVRLIEKTPPRSFEEEYFNLKNQVSRDDRSHFGKEVVLNRLKKEYGFREFGDRLEEVGQRLDGSIFEGRWDRSTAEDLDQPLITFSGQTYTQQDFVNYLHQTQGYRTPENITAYTRNIYQNWVEQKIMEYEDSRLEEKYPEFRSIMREYHDGILLFELTDQLVWSRAVEDTTGLKAFFEANQENYMWGERLEATIYLSKDVATARRAYRQIRQAQRRGLDHESVLSSMNEQAHTDVSARHGLFERGDEPILEEIDWKTGLSRPFAWNDRVAIVHIHKVLPAQPKQMNEIRGMLIADYQNHLEKLWVKELREKYQVDVNSEVLQSINF
jgi:peptidyl-prolyl cis-trans isomerase SurA